MLSAAPRTTTYGAGRPNICIRMCFNICQALSLIFRTLSSTLASLYGLLRLYRSRVGSALSYFSLAVRGNSRSSRTIAPLTLRALLPTGMYGASRGLTRGCVYSPCLSFGLTRLRAYTRAASTAACAASRRCRRVVYSGSVSQWVASRFNAVNSPTSAERSRAVSLVTSLGSCGPLYGSLIICPKSVE